MRFIKNRLGVFTLSLLALANTLSPAYGVSFFVNGTYAGDTRFNVKKLFDGQDDNLCWAAAASNILDFWQMRNIGYLPENVPHGQTQLSYSSDVFYTFVHSFQSAGGYEIDGISWWLNGIFQKSYEYEMRIPALSQGSYYSDFGWSSSDLLKMVDVDDVQHSLFDVLHSSLKVDSLLTADIYGGLDGDEAHAISLWGYELDDVSGDLIGLWVGDSDDTVVGNVLVGISWNDLEEQWDMGGKYERWYVGSVTQFHAPMIPEPLYGAFMLGAAALALLVCRRRRAKTATAGCD